jgi:uncharacterized protein YgiM (DUF1202 family)
MSKAMRAAIFGIAGAFVFGGVALAAKVGDNLYVKAKNTKVMDGTAATANVVVVLQPGEQVQWQGAEADKKWHKVTAKGKSGVVFVSNLSSQKPSTEIVASQGGKAMDTQAFASSGAATKALGEGPKEMANEKGLQKAAADLEFAEGLAKKVTPADINAHSKKSGIFPVVGEKGDKS